MTFDTSVKIDAFDTPTKYHANSKMYIRVKAARRLKDAHEQGRIKIFYNGGEKSGKPDEVSTFFQVRGPWIVGFEGFSEVGVSTIAVSEEFASLVGEVFAPPKVSSNTSNHTMRDFAFLVEHVNAKRDIFVSEDRGHLKHAEKFKPHGVVIMSAAETVSFLAEQNVL